LVLVVLGHRLILGTKVLRETILFLAVLHPQVVVAAVLRVTVMVSTAALVAVLDEQQHPELVRLDKDILEFLVRMPPVQ
jgi:hypothetical protein